MRITSFKNGNLNLILEPDHDKAKYSGYTLDGILNNDDLCFANLHFLFDTNGDLWLLDYSKKLGYVIANYFSAESWKHYKFFRTLLEGKTVKLVPYGSFSDIKEFFEGEIQLLLEEI